MAGKVIDVTGADFAEVTGQSGLTLFDLWSPTCAPCRMLAPVLDDLAVDFTGEVRICKADVSADVALGERFAARALPTLALYRDGREVDRIVGTRSRAQLSNWLESHL
ncbi:thioredoxin family protein [Sphingomonas sp. NPDC019816]|uniref:thioredoxin family protein n=1 Tax=Sphingomonas sp. NPDC019816 TaxID=3390679 RepID=UPI003CFC4EED